MKPLRKLKPLNLDSVADWLASVELAVKRSEKVEESLPREDAMSWSFPYATRSLGRFSVLASAAFAMCLIMAAPTLAQKTSKTDFRRNYSEAQASIAKGGGKVVSSSSAWLRKKTAIYGKVRSLKSSETILALAGSDAKANSIPKVIGDAPKGFGQTLPWDPADEELAVVAFVNPADVLGILITGVTKGDTIEVVSASGIASYSEDTKNEGVAGFIGVVGVGAGIAATAFGAPEIVPLVTAATKYAQEQWKEEKVKTKRRDAFGVDPGSQHKARQEGGILISMPAAGGPITSGNNDHRENWIKEPGDRVAKNYPPQVKNAFFVTRDRPSARATVDGDIYIIAWDHKFEDNFGFYRVNLLLKRGDTPDPGDVD
ncbi:hypothetical protein NKJ90_19495 [Mesorhizobium sp. M0051]|uniref:hypothetical protein n=1 Tax=Mesorhizobium sp. M0051 TaxID=2956862 RepID=UPI003334EF21